MREILEPAIRLAREGVPQYELSSNQVRQMVLELPRRANALSLVADCRTAYQASFFQLERVSAGIYTIPLIKLIIVDRMMMPDGVRMTYASTEFDS